MKHRIYYSDKEQLYQIETKRLFVKWETRKSYLYTDLDGNFISAKGFFTFEQAEEWVNDRFPIINNLNEVKKNKNIGFEF